MKLSKRTIFSLLALVLTMVLLGACAETQESNTTWKNRQKIVDAIPLPDLNYSTRRLVIAKYYLILERPRLATCTYVMSRGNGGDAVIPTFGPSVNLSNQLTSPGQSEADSVYVGQNDQTLFVLRNGNYVTSEADVVTVGGECPEGVHPDTYLQAVLDYASGITPEFDFTNTDGLGP